MQPSQLLINILLLSLLTLNLFLVLFTISVKTRARVKYIKKRRLHGLIKQSVISGKPPDVNIPPRDRYEFFLCIKELSSSIEIPVEIKNKYEKLFSEWRIENHISRRCRSPFLKKRAGALPLLDFIDKKQRQKILQQMFVNEKTVLLRLKIIEMLCPLELALCIDDIAASMKRGTEQYRQKVIHIVSVYCHKLTAWADLNRNTSDPEIRRIIIKTARTRTFDWFHEFLLAQTESPDLQIRTEAAEVLFNEYQAELDLDALLMSPRIDIKQKAAEHLVSKTAGISFEKISELFKDYSLSSSVISALRKKIINQPQLIQIIFDRYLNSEEDSERLGWASVLSIKISYFIFQLNGAQGPEIRELIDDVVSLRQSSYLIDFLNGNRNPEIEALVFETIAPQLVSNEYFRQQCQLYLDSEVQLRWEISDFKEIIDKPKIQLNRKDKIYMSLFLAAVLVIPILSFFLSSFNTMRFFTTEELFVKFIFHYHFIFIFYTAAINSIYIILMLLSWISINKQNAEWRLIDKRFLFTPGILSSVSILAPAYNEEKTIIQNVYSLLSLEYPELEVIIISDGSTDNTAELLIEHFQFEFTDFESTGIIETAPVKGIYKSRIYPNLIFINKQNGGKADALNAGLNVASGEHICSIDADSLLEPESLQKIMFRTLINQKETAAIGGNIIPSNGLRVENGSIREIHLPGNRYARYQTIEYLRSFVAGRLGWTKTNSLLIISGAFGVFKRKRLIDIGGYMTGTGAMRKDTVGEDMELVVRLFKDLSDKKIPFTVDYAHNANCWTEVPEDLNSLVKQRDRWHRGLIEIMLYHKKMLFRRIYKSAGFIAFPYFYFFELAGPFWEALGYIVLIVSLIFGLVSNQIFLLMFTVVILSGISISTMALFLAEKGVVYFKGRDFFKAIFTAIIENFGYRQFISILRTTSFISYLFKNKGWQKLERRGFNQHPAGKGGKQK